MFLQLRHQSRQLAVKLKGFTVLHGKDHMMRLLLQIQKLREKETTRLSVLLDNQPGNAFFLQFDQPQEIIQILLPNRFFQILQHRKPIAFQSVVGTGGSKGDGNLLIHLPNSFHCFHAGHPIHINIHQQQIKVAGAEYFQQFLAAPELGGDREDEGLFQQAKQLFALLRPIIADGNA